MKKFFIILLFLICLPAYSETLRANVSYDELIKGFSGTWHVTSKIDSATNYSIFNKLSVDIWNLSGSGNVLILENALTGAISNIKIDNPDKTLNGRELKFTRVKEYKDGAYIYKHTEMPEFVLNGKVFKGYDTLKIEKFDTEGKLISVDVVKYKVVGQKIAGE
ncbi:MAG: hypothetical protein LUE64_04630 [Candidatus Gastranaerophilales bacterium]|nr:hypothetical protein [Candidatus Gastranaerophilales bacterium]